MIQRIISRRDPFRNPSDANRWKIGKLSSRSGKGFQPAGSHLLAHGDGRRWPAFLRLPFVLHPLRYNFSGNLLIILRLLASDSRPRGVCFRSVIVQQIPTGLHPEGPPSSIVSRDGRTDAVSTGQSVAWATAVLNFLLP